MSRKITISLLVLGISCAFGQQEFMRMAMMSKLFGGGTAGATGFGGMDPLTTMALMKGGGNSKALSMMAMMNMLKPNPPTAGAADATGAAGVAGVAGITGVAGVAGATPVAAGDPMTNTIMQMSLCSRSEAAAESRICTPLTCKLQSLARHGTPNLLQCRPLLGCCFSDVKSMYMANMLKSM